MTEWFRLTNPRTGTRLLVNQPVRTSNKEDKQWEITCIFCTIQHGANLCASISVWHLRLGHTDYHSLIKIVQQDLKYSMNIRAFHCRRIFFCSQRRLWIGVLWYVKTLCLFYFEGGKIFRGCAAGKSVKNNTFYWFLARRTSTVCMKITAFWEMKDDVMS